MWQHLLNIVLGLVLIIVALVAMGAGTLIPALTLTFGLIGIAIAMVALGGFFAGMAKSPHIDLGPEDV